MAEVHPDFGELYPYSDHKRGDHVSYRVADSEEQGEIVWVATGGPLPNGRDMPPHYWIVRDGDGFPDAVLFGDLVMNAQPPQSLDHAPFLEIANSTIAQSRAEKWTIEKTKRVAIAACVRSIEKHGEMSDQAQVTIEVIVDEAMNREPRMVRCPYCRQWHFTQHVEQCPLRS